MTQADRPLKEGRERVAIVTPRSARPRITSMKQIEMKGWIKMNPIFNAKEVLPYHPDYGMPESIRSEAILLSIKYGTRRAASLLHLGESTIHKWRKDCGLNKAEKKNV